MLFCKKMPRSCSYCIHGTDISNNEILCVKRGVTSVYHSCRKFKYDPCKRIPPKPKTPNFAQFNDEDFSL